MARKNVPRQFVGQRLKHRHSMARTNHSLNQSVDFKSMDNSSKFRIAQNFHQGTKYIVQKSTSPDNQYDRTKIFSAEIPKRSHIKSTSSSRMGFNIPLPQTQQGKRNNLAGLSQPSINKDLMTGTHVHNSSVESNMLYGGGQPKKKLMINQNSEEILPVEQDQILKLKAVVQNFNEGKKVNNVKIPILQGIGKITGDSRSPPDSGQMRLESKQIEYEIEPSGMEDMVIKNNY